MGKYFTLKLHCYYLKGDTQSPGRSEALLHHIDEILEGFGIDYRVITEGSTELPIYKFCVDELWHGDIIQAIVEMPIFDIGQSGYALKPFKPQQKPQERAAAYKAITFQ